MNTENQHNAVLVLDADTLPALAIARSLGRAGLTVSLASHSEHPLAARSRYVAEVLQYPSPLSDEANFLQWLEQILVTRPEITMIVPATERTMVPISRHFTKPDQRRRFALPNAEALERVLDKSLTAELAETCEVPQPRHWTINEPEDALAITSALDFPVVVKPARSISDGDQRQALTVGYAHNPEQLQLLLNHMLPRTHVILQEYFTGEGIGIELIARHGEILYAFQHRRVHEVPLTGGGSSLRVSEALIPELLEASRKLIRELRWHGVAMVEFKWQPDSRRFILIEINGRFWGSLPLATAAGADFPRLLWHLHIDDELPALPPYRTGVLCRKLSADLAWFEAVLRRDADTQLVKLPSRWQATKDMLAMFRPSQRFDAQSLSDPLPGLVDVGNILCNYWQRATELAKEWLGNRRERFRNRWSTTAKAVQSAHNILFVCYGNINRSALAEGLANRRQLPNCSFQSAGFHPEADRSPDPRMCALAHEHNADISNQRSRIFTQELADWADVILVMEVDQLARAAALSQGKPVHLLGGLMKESLLAQEIADPYNQPLETYARVYTEIERCIDHLVQLKTSQ